MPRFFVSYSRADRRFVDDFIPLLEPVYGRDSVWFDDQIPGGVDWWEMILGEVRRCDIFIYLLSNDSLTSPYCQDECREALRLNKPILQVIARPKTEIKANLPDDLKGLLKLQYVDLSKIDLPANTKLHAAIRALEARLANNAAARPEPVVDVNTAIVNFFQADKEGKWGLAREWLARIRLAGNVPNFFDLDTYEKSVLANEARDQQYAVLQIMAQHDTPARIWNALQIFWQTYPGYDPDTLARFKPPPPKPSDPLTEATARALLVLPQPFVWMPVSAGRVTLIENYDDQSYFGKKGEARVFDVPNFALAKYPITNAQFERFIADNGYTTQAFWTAEGWKLKEKQGWKEPRYWADSKWNQPDCPVVGVSWFEAAAFCLWLSRKTGDNIHLPTEQMWQRAAGGDEGLAYPWGNEWDGERCNNSVSPFSSDRTSPVTQYEGKGDSPFSIVDISGNVWEWCLTDYDTGNQDSKKSANRRVLRGGAWGLDDTEGFRADFRVRLNPDYWNDFIGFRPARS